MHHAQFSIKRIVLAASLVALAGTAMAQTAPVPPAGDARPHQAREHVRKDPAQRAERLKQALHITPEQEPAWNVFTASMLPAGPRAERPDRAERRAMTTPQRIEHMRAMQAKRTEAMERRAEATLRLYAALTPEQQQVFDQRTAGPRHHHHGMPPRPGHKG